MLLFYYVIEYMKALKKLIVIGAGGFGQEVFWVAENINQKNLSEGKPAEYEMIGYCDDNTSIQGKEIYSYKNLGVPEDLKINGNVYFFCSIGNNLIRKEVVARAIKLGWQPETLIDPSVIRAREVEVGDGTYVGAGTILSPNAKIGSHVIINLHCTIGHDSTLADYAHICPGSRLSGNTILKEGAFVASNSVTKQNIVMEEYSVLGASSFLVRNLPARCTALGNPARVIVKN